MTQIEQLLRSTLHAHARATTPVPDETDVRHRVRRRRRRRQLVPAVGAAAAITVGVSVTAFRQSDEPRTSTAAHVPGSDTLPRAIEAGAPALLVLPDWSTVRYQEITYEFASGGGAPQVSIEGEGTKITVTVFAPPMGFSIGDGASSVEVNGHDARVVERDGDVVWLVWGVGELTVVLDATGVPVDEVVDVARGLTFEGSQLAVTAVRYVPAGMTAHTLATPSGAARNVEYQFANAAQRLQLHLYDGGRAVYEARIGGDLRSTVTVLGRAGSLLDYGNGRYRVDVLIDDHTWEFDGEPFGSLDDFLTTVDSIQLVDQTAWEQSVADADVSSFDATDDHQTGATTPPEPPIGVDASTTAPAAK